jgi:hypothetical protein
MTMFATAGKAGSMGRPAADTAGWLRLAATPTFALMAGVSGVGSAGTMMCSVVPAFVPIDDMALMYLLMSFFHASPWLTFLSGRLQRGNAPTTQTEGD